jgi:trans-aconitate methyltransferase
VTDETQAPPGVDPAVPTAARMYDYFLGGHDNFAADRAAADVLTSVAPAAPLTAQANRAFLGRAVRFLAGEAGLRQFLDLGAGLPTRGSVHQVAREITPDARVVYVDSDPMVVAHARALDAGPATAVIQADLRDARAVLEHPETRRLIDVGQPVAVLCLGTAHFIGGPEAAAAVARFTAALAPGSYLALSHAHGDPQSREYAAGTQAYSSTASPITMRSRAEILGFFAGLELVEPGLVRAQAWRPAPSDPPDGGQDWLLAAVGRVPAPAPA